MDKNMENKRRRNSEMYSQHMLAREEYNLMVRSLPPVYENRNQNSIPHRTVSRIRVMFLTLLHLVIK